MIRDRQARQIPLGALLGFELVAAEPGRIAFELATDERMVNSGGIVHGGVLSLVLDQAVGDAVRTLLPDEVRYVTLDLHLTYLRPVVPGSSVRCEAWVNHLGTHIAHADGTVTDSTGDEGPLCTCRSTLYLLREAR